MNSTRRGALVLTLFAVVAGLLHAKAGHAFPVPWPDEIDFLTPAARFARHGSLRVPELGAPDGIFWVSDVYYFVLAPVLRFLPSTVDVGRGVSFVAVLVAATGFWTAARKATVPPVAAAVIAGLWLLMPRVVLAGNVVRHEAIVLACVAWALAATLHHRRVGALALGFFAAMLHPAAVPFFLVLAVFNLRRPDGIRRWEWIAVGIVGLVFAVELVHFGTNLSTVADHLRFQAERKVDRYGRGTIGVALLLVIGGAVVARRRGSTDNDASGVFIAITLAACSLAVVGKEMWYEVYWFETAALLIVTTVLVMWKPFAIRRFALLATATACVGVQGYVTPFYGMQFGTDSHEWDAFVTDVAAELHALDAASDEPITVAVSALSGLPWPAKTATIGNVRIVKETPITSADAPDYTLFARTVCCTGKQTVPSDLGELVATVESQHKVFDATLFRNRPAPSASS